MRALVFVADLICFASFGWAMLRHFGRAGKPKPGMIVTASVVPVFAGVNLEALLTRPLAYPSIAILLYAAGGALFWFAIAATRGRGLAACFQRQAPSAVVCCGPYRAIRHPFYCAYTLVWAGGFAATGWWPLAAIALFMASLYVSATRKEEADFLASPRQTEYRAYMRRTGRFVPRVGRGRSLDPSDKGEEIANK
jgi:protein-S-isoprenylcysteine O-methyltransferase Ste14